MIDWYVSWATRHAEVFGLDSESDHKTILSWSEALAATEDELHAATSWLAANPEAIGRTEARFAGRLTMHLAAIQARLRAQRAIDYQSHIREHDRPDRGTCTRCGGAGRVVVPHIASVKDGDWLPMNIARGGPSYYTMAIWCGCQLGQWMESRHDTSRWPPLMSFGEYVMRNPRWQIQMYRRQEKQIALGKLEPDRMGFGALLKRLREQHSGEVEE